MKACHACGEPWDGSPGSQPGKSETCPKCDADLHTCLNCRHHDPACHNECKSSTAERVKDKDRHNSCDEFQFVDKVPGKNGAPGGASKDDMEAKWKQLFG